MAERKRGRPAGKRPESYGWYVEGNAIRKEEREREEYVRVSTRKEKKAYHARKNWEKARFMTVQYVMVLFAASVLTVLVSVNYLQARNAINSSVKTLSSLETEIEALKESNNGLKKSIDNFVDLEYIYDVATQELGMVPVSKEQIIRFDRSESEYVRQNEDIPTD